MHALPLKEYQIKVLESIDTYIKNLKSVLDEKQDYYEFQLSKGKEAVNPLAGDYLNETWEQLKAIIDIPLVKDIKSGRKYPSNWHNRIDGIGHKIPNISLKVPTGGGKTLLSVEALKRIIQDYKNTHTGLVLWVVPTEPIFKQTLKAFCNREHPYRMALDQISGGQTRILERHDSFTPQDIQDNLCVMVLMLQSFNVGKNKKDARKIYNDSGQYEGFFPQIDDFNANKALLEQVKNLIELDLEEKSIQEHNVIDGIYLKHSLGNVFRLLKPVVVIDEEHKAKSKKAIDNINDFNPSFILELSATPRENSNKLVDVSGSDLKQEEMIKLPIVLDNYPKTDWRDTLNHAVKSHLKLQETAMQYHQQSGTYIRPIMVIIAENTKGDKDHVEEIKMHLIDKCQIQEGAIKKKLSGLDEIQNINLLDPLCSIDFIITKDALKEGWDCPFAYTLTILANKDNAKNLTQYIGRVLRQPYATRTDIEALNMCYVFCHFEKVNESIEAIKNGLESEGLGDVAGNILDRNNESEIKLTKITQKRRQEYINQKIFLPSLTSVINGIPHKFDYHRDILSKIDWSLYHFDIQNMNLQSQSLESYKAKLDLDKDNTLLPFDETKQTIKQSKEIDLSLMISWLTEKIPNAFQASRIINQIIQDLINAGHTKQEIAAEGAFIVSEIKKNAFTWLLGHSEAIFGDAIKSGDIFLKLIASPYQELNWDLGETRTIAIPDNTREDSTLNHNIFQPQYDCLYNKELEYPVAKYINDQSAMSWWHRLGIKGTEYALQGWKNSRIYPDFLIKREGNKYIFIETKGNHLKNEDSAYKQKVFNILNQSQSVTVGEFKLESDQPELSFHLVYDDEWENDLRGIL